MKQGIVILGLLLTLELSGCNTIKNHNIDFSQNLVMPSVQDIELKLKAQKSNMEPDWITLEESYADDNKIKFFGKLNINAFDYVILDTSTLDIVNNPTYDIGFIKDYLLKYKESADTLKSADTKKVREPLLGIKHNKYIVFAVVTFTNNSNAIESSLDDFKIVKSTKDNKFTIYSGNNKEIAVANNRTWELINALHLGSDRTISKNELTLDEINTLQQLQSLYILESSKGLSAVVIADNLEDAAYMSVLLMDNVKYLEMKKE